MKAFKSGIIGLMILAGTAATAFAGQERLEGGHDGGGGSLVQSTEAQVREAIDWAFGELRDEPQGGSWLFMASPYGPDVPGIADKRSVLFCLGMGDLCNADEMMRKIENDEPTYAGAWSYLKESRVELKVDGPCPASDKKNAAASVSAYKVGADLCLSISELRKTPPTALRAQVASILAHEMSHLRGFDEAIAQQVQEAVAVNFPQISKSDGSFLKYRLVSLMMWVESCLFNAKSFSQEGNLYPGIYLLGMTSGTLHSIVEIIPDDINDRTIPVDKPEMFGRVKGALEDLDDKALRLSWKAGTLSDAEFDAEVEVLKADALAASLLLEEFLGQKVYRK